MAALTTKRVVMQSRQHVMPALAVAFVSKRPMSNIAAYRRGTGGRSSFSGIVATVFGASGFLGKYVVNRLGKIGSQVIIPYRGEPYYVKDLKLAGDLGQIQFLPIDLKDENSLRHAMKYSNVVVNLIGRDYETRNFKFEDVHVRGAAKIASIAKEMGVQKFIQFSHLNASPNPTPIYMKGGSKYLITKYYGEEAVREVFPEAIIFRPADIYGQEDRFLQYYASKWRRSIGTIPLWRKGAETVKMPVLCDDVAHGVVNAIRDPDSDGKIYDCVGPHSFYLSDLVDYLIRCLNREGTTTRGYVTPLFWAKVNVSKRMPATPILNMERIEREFVSDVLTWRNPTLEDLGVKLTRLEDRAPWELKGRRMYNYYEYKVGEQPNPAPPKILAAH